MDFDKIKHAILAEEDLPRERFATPEWASVDGHVWLRTMSAQEREWVYAVKDGPCFSARLLSKCLCDENGRLLFSEGELHELAGKSSVVIERAAKAAITLNRLGRAALQEEQKNSEAGPS